MTDRKPSVIPSVLQDVSGIAPKKQPKPRRKVDELQGMFVRLDPAVITQFRVLCAENGKSQTEMASEALNMLFARYGKGQIA